ncbi:MAG TPA: lytic transglycosylase domain-containing protein [Vampirovibrionales bacterium]
MFTNLFSKVLPKTFFSSQVLFISLVIVSPTVASEVEIFLGNNKVVVDSETGQAKNGLPEIITPGSFDPFKPKIATVPTAEELEAFKQIRANKRPAAKLFTFNDFQVLETSPFMNEALKHPQVLASLKELNKWGNPRLQKAQSRLNTYGSTIQQIFNEEGVPKELIALGFVESTFDPNAVSRSGAKGIWQFIPSTGKMYGLNDDSDFKDPVKSTKAAAKYLKTLHGIFQDWPLAIAAYNAGDYRVQQAIRRAGGVKNFWEISRFLPSETRRYVPRVLAATKVLVSQDGLYMGNKQ